MWVDPVHEVIGIYLSFSMVEMESGNPNWDLDRYQNMVTAAVQY